MPNYRRVRTPGATYFFTVVTHERRPILCADEVPSLLLATIREVCSEMEIVTDALVILPEHLHCLWTLPETSSAFSKAWALIKLRFTKQVKDRFAAGQPISASRAKKRESTIWQRRFWEHQVRDQADFDSHFHYIHFNPVKHGLVSAPCEWEHTTFHRFVQEGIYSTDWGGLDEWPAHVGQE